MSRSGRHEPLPRTRLYLPLAVIMLAFVPSLFGAISAAAWVSEFIKWIEIVLLVLIVLDLRQRWTWIAFGVVLAAVLQALIGLYEFRGGSGAPHLWIANYRYFRAFGTFGQPNPFSAFMGLTLPLALGLAWGYLSEAFVRQRAAAPLRRSPNAQLNGRSKQRPYHYPRMACAGMLAGIYAGCALMLLAGLIASWGRGAWLGFGAAGVVLVLFAPRRRWIGFLLLAAGGVLSRAAVGGGLCSAEHPAADRERRSRILSDFGMCAACRSAMRISPLSSGWLTGRPRSTWRAIIRLSAWDWAIMRPLIRPTGFQAGRVRSDMPITII